MTPHLLYLNREGSTLSIFSGKLNKLRTFALVFMFAGLALMYIGYAFFAGYFGNFLKNSIAFMTTTIIIGFFLIMISTIIYATTGMISQTSTQVVCPTCGKVTKMLGKTDHCMFCNQGITLDPNEATDRQSR